MTKNESQRDLNNDLFIISEWAFQWKVQYNPDSNKQAYEVYCPRKHNTDYYFPIKLNDSLNQLCESQNNAIVILDKHLNFHEHIGRKIKVCTKLIGAAKPVMKDNLDRVLFADELEFPKILVPRLHQHTSNVNIECAGKSKQLHSFYTISFFEH